MFNITAMYELRQSWFLNMHVTVRVHVCVQVGICALWHVCPQHGAAAAPCRPAGTSICWGGPPLSGGRLAGTHNDAPTICPGLPSDRDVPLGRLSKGLTALHNLIPKTLWRRLKVRHTRQERRGEEESDRIGCGGGGRGKKRGGDG